MQKPDYNFDESFAFLEILRILSNTEKFHNWLREYHHLQSIDDILEGYKYIISTSLKCFIQSLMLNDPFKLKDDRFLIRGDFRIGKSLDDVPNRCEKTIFMKNVWNCGKDIRKAKSWEEIDDAKSLSDLLNLFENLFRDSIRSNSTISKEDAIRFVAQFWTYLELVDCRFGMPKGSRVSLFEIEESTVYLDKVFAGYLYSLQFLWFELLGDEKFKKSVLKDLHRATEIKFERPDDSVTISFEELGYEVVEMPETEEEKQRRLEHERVFKKWESIDQFFEEIKYEIIRPLEKDLDNPFGSMREGLLELSEFDKNMIKGLLKKETIQEPTYFLSLDKESIKKQIDCELWWYDVGALNAGQSFDFSGPFAFIPMLTGYVNVLHEKEIEDEVSVMVLKHPSSENKGNEYSFGILVSVGGFISDASGWLIFFDATSDYSSDELHEQCMETIKKFQAMKKISLRELTIDKEIFKEFLAERNISIDSASMSRIYENAEDLISKLRGKFFEYVVYKWLADSNRYTEVKCDVSVNGSLIDCFGRNDKSIDVYECKIQLHGNDDKQIINQVNTQVQAFTKNDSSLQIRSHLVVYQPVLLEIKSKLEESGIIVHQNFREVIQNDEAFDGSRRNIRSFLESNFRYRYRYF